jgi:alkylation response protein AidB-like acyl-CoA dehydrogenase
MQLELTEEQRALRQRARAFAQERLTAGARAWDEERRFPLEVVPELAGLGFLGGPVPQRYGGSGFDYVSTALVYEELGRVDSSVRGFLAVHTGLVSMCLNDWGDEAQKREWLPKLAAGQAIGCYALTEPGAGSDVASMTSTATRDGNGYRLNGNKHWITNGNIAHLSLVFASTEPAQRHKGITAFLVPTDTPGFLRERMTAMELGHRAADHARITLRDCWVPDAAVLGQPGQGFGVAMGALDHGRLGVAAGAVGLAQGCLDACLAFANQRVQFGKPIGEFQMIQQQIADMAVEMEAARLLTYRAAAQKDAGQKNTLETSMAKLYATEVAGRAANVAVVLHGSYGYNNERPVERLLRDAKGYEIYEGTSHIQRLIIARALLKQQREQAST